MTDSHVHSSSCDTDPPTGSHDERTNIPSKVTLTVSGVVSGYGAAGGAFRSAVIDGETVADWNGNTGEQSESLESVGICGFAGTSAKAYKENKTIDFSVSGDSDEDLGTDHQWSATGGIYTRGIEWIGTASSSVEVGWLAGLDTTPSLQVSAKKSGGITMRYQQARDRGWSSTPSNGTWEVVPLYSCSKCGGTSQSSSDWLRLSDAHSHHFICGGCGKHVKCKRSRGNHVEVSCPQENGVSCSYGSYYQCSPHTHAYSGSGSGNMGSNTGSSNTMLACGVHSTSESGDHSLQASCSTDSSCISTNFYLCSHTHSYSSADNTPDCSYCTDGCSLCPSDDPPDGECQLCGGANYYPCVYCGETFDTCYSHIPNCPSSGSWHSSQ